MESHTVTIAPGSIPAARLGATPFAVDVIGSTGLDLAQLLRWQKKECREPIMVTIDHVTKCEIDPALGGNELRTLSYLSVGLHQLYANVTLVEKPLRESDDRNHVRQFAYGNAPGLPQGTAQLLPCYFHWYGVSLMNYARLVGFLSGLSSGAFTHQHLADEKEFQTVTDHCDTYVRSIPELSAVKVWRDKVAAHLAITKPRKGDDNPALLDLSVMHPVSYYNGRYRAGAIRVIRTDAAGKAHIGKLPTWSLTEIHEALRQRYWKGE
jgi:hypothetical protein